MRLNSELQYKNKDEDMMIHKRKMQLDSDEQRVEAQQERLMLAEKFNVQNEKEMTQLKDELRNHRLES